MLHQSCTVPAIRSKIITMPLLPIRAITSRQNSRVKQLRAAMQRSGGEYVALEGEHLILEAQRSGIALESVFIQEGFEDRLERLSLAPDGEVLSLAADIFASAVTTESPQPLAAIIAAPRFELSSVLGDGTRPALIVIAAALQDPGNLGTLIRSAEAFGATGILLLPGTVSPWNSKALRASAGSALRLPIVHCDEREIAVFLREAGVRILAAVAYAAQDATPIATCNFTQPTAILIGNEGSGLPPDLLAMADAHITIPHTGITESLNAAVAGSILLYEAARQRGFV